MFEMEYLQMVHQPALRKVYELTRQGWSGQFGAIDIWEQVEQADRLMWKNMQRKAIDFFPNTFLEISNCNDFLFFESQSSSLESKRQAAEEKARELKACILAGIAAGAKEFDKNFEYLNKVPHIVLAMFCRGFAGPALRVFVYVLQRLGLFKSLRTVAQSRSFSHLT